MKLYTENELIFIVENADNKEDLRQVANYLYANKNLYQHLYISITSLCMSRVLQLAK